MALATQCPHCHTTFRVAHDQLKLRAGLVRCGSCKQIFNGIENLLRTENLEQPAPPLPSPPTPIHPARPAEKIGTPETPEETPTPAGSDEARNNPLLRMTLMDIAPAQGKSAEPEPQDTGLDDSLESAIDDLQSKPWRTQGDLPSDALDRAEAAEYEEPAFVRRGRRKQRIGHALRLFMTAASVVLLFALLGEGTYVFRDRIATWFPQAKPVLVAACAHLGCQLALPAQIDDVSIESSELQTLAANADTFSLTVLLRNRSATAQAWPHIELTLNDANEKAIARRVFAPREYLPAAQDTAQGFSARSEQQVKLFFELSQLKASGYRVYLFYP